MADIIALRRTTQRRHSGNTSAGVAELIQVRGLAGLVKLASPDTGGPDGVGERTLPVLPELRALLPAGGLRRGSTVAVAAGHPVPLGAVPAGGLTSFGATTVLLALLAAASAAGSWCAVVGLPALGLAAAAELGVALDRLALVPEP